MGQKIRAAEAGRLLNRMDKYEATVAACEVTNRQITDEIERMNADHRLQMDYMISFGVRAEHREAIAAFMDKRDPDFKGS